jgi:hypothetical protein
MRWLRTLVIFDQASISATQDWQSIHASIVRSIQSIDFPPGSGALTIRRKTQLANNQWRRNGVGYLKRSFFDHLVNVEHWQPEVGVSLDNIRPATLATFPHGAPYVEPVTSSFGPFDFVTTGPTGLRVAVEWETGNISSSHRSMNKMALAIEMGVADAALMIVPSRALYAHLTDRIGNISELSGYLAMWQGMGRSLQRGLMCVAVVEHDALTDTGEYLPVGNDGRAAQGQARLRGEE